MLEAMYEGQQLKQQQKELSLYSAKLKKDAFEREAKISTSSLAKLEQECHIDALERLSLQSQELE
jgi:trans-2-enoyl-CoA reductase